VGARAAVVARNFVSSPHRSPTLFVVDAESGALAGFVDADRPDPGNPRSPRVQHLLGAIDDLVYLAGAA